MRIAIHAGDDETGMGFLYEIPNDTLAPAYIPGILRTVLTGLQMCSVPIALASSASTFAWPTRAPL
ncbi:hypothetical protein [Streptomyces sp. NPDC101165]|uniref:hypothetical protein n=1 Tax=Streptomyces sp. NPDC101165 TaxID=3366119 RepID=UPI00380D3E02